MQHLTRLTLLVATLAALAGCSGTAETGTDTPETGPTACGGSITTEPSIIAELPSGARHFTARAILAKGTRAYVLSNAKESGAGTITAVDLCSHTTSTLASFEHLGQAVIEVESMLLSVDRGGGYELARLPLDGGDIEPVATPPGSVEALENTGTRIVVAAANPSGSGGVELFELAGNALVRFNGITVVPDPYYGSTPRVFVAGASAEGVYAEVPTHGGTSRLNLYPFDGGYPDHDLAHTVGARDLAVSGDRLIIAGAAAASFGDPGIVSMSLTATEPEVLLEPGSGHTRSVSRITADERSICWLPRSDANDDAPRCMPRAGGEVRVLGDSLGAFWDLELTDGVLVWTVATQEGTKVMAAIP